MDGWMEGARKQGKLASIQAWWSSLLAVPVDEGDIDEIRAPPAAAAVPASRRSLYARLYNEVLLHLPPSVSRAFTRPRFVSVARRESRRRPPELKRRSAWLAHPAPRDLLSCGVNA
jgi:hypothetical protein